MQRLISVVVLCYIICIIIIFFNLADAEESKPRPHRQKRFLTFINGSKFFLRFNFKANMVPWNQIFAQALGFRMNWDDPPNTFRPYHRLHRRTLYSHLETLLDKNGLNGYQCVRRAICEIASDQEPKEIYNKVLKMVFRRQSSDTDRWHNATENDCLSALNECPFSFGEVALYTDV